MTTQEDSACLRYHDETSVIREFLVGLQETEGSGREKFGDIPKISIVTPSFNQAKYLERTILSVLNQGYRNLEFIIIDGGSTDGSVDIIKKYSRYLAYWHSGPDGGQSDALNHGFSKATGDIYGWLNSDDLYAPDALCSMVEAFRLHPDASVVFGDWWEIDSSDKVASVNYAFDFSLGHFIFEGFHLNSQAMFWRRAAHQRFGAFDINLCRTMDYDLILRMGLVEGERAFYRIPQVLGCFRRHSEQKTIGLDSRVLDEHCQIAKKNGIGNKYSLVGKATRLGYRLRRAYWYIKRGGVMYALVRSSDWRMRLKEKMSFGRASGCTDL